MGLDFGTVRTGVAFADDDVKVPSPHGVVTGAPQARADALASLAREHDVVGVVLGLPLSLSGDEGAASLRVRRFARLLEKALPDIPLHFCDERFSTQAVSKTGGRGKRRGEEVDAAAAAWVLQIFLESRGSVSEAE